MDQLTVPEDRIETRPPQRARRSVRRRPRRRPFRYTLPGLAGALVLLCVSLTPSLLPRTGLTQGLISGITAAFGYGVGVLAAGAWRAVVDRDARPARRRSWLVLGGVALVSFVAATAYGRYWQARIRELMDAPADSALSVVVVPAVAAVVFVLLVALARAVRRVCGSIALLLDRWIGARAARAVGWAVVLVGSALLLSGIVVDQLVAAADRAFSVRDGRTDEGVVAPTGAERSGGPGSLVDWGSLGREGRTFVGTGPSAGDIAAFTGAPATQPVRAYAGLDSAPTTELRARLAVDDLVRAGGLDRAVLLVVTTTGSGWVDPGAVDPVEYLAGGDSAAVAIQYSYLPSFVSYLVDSDRAREAGRELFDAVYERWNRLPLDGRPRLVVTGESLGSFGGETAFSGEYDLRNRTGGAVFAGPPEFNTLYREFVSDRDEGSPEIEPEYRDGRTVRFTDDPGEEIAPVTEPWDGSRVLYLLHPSDPVVWWTPELVYARPTWLEEHRGEDVVDAVRWIPFVTFWQVTADLPFAGNVPDGHGHVYRSQYVDAWVHVLQPPGWDAERVAQLRDLLARGG
ncbi:putative membrane protein [Geodermatophilus bullaregiensis]|uniref:alpha/beta hydrolase n=1 Tax=Geodermatophilus bullaregiensis TaxID=1564160 RepID=UPI00195CA9DD|nr:alpha/beta-hydrolase family protein [Geodermatophilus bullaregiensis]MBM7809012.1 putative membrane protein [Geodermatophilus bullaregiensis]